MTLARTLRAALYIRVSLEEQAKHGFSINGQLEALQKYCRLHRFEVYDIYIDAGASGTSVNGRPELGRMLEDGKANRFDIVVVWRISRLSRDIIDLLELVQTLKQHHISFHSVADHFDSDSDYGNFTLQMMGAVAQLERDYTVDSVKLTTLERSRQGNWNCGNNVLGYRWIRNPEGRGGRVEIVPDEANLVIQIFELYATGRHGLKSIAFLLNREGHKTKTGRPFTIISVRGVLLNRNYIGMVRYNVSDNRRSKGKVAIEWSKGKHQPIVPLDLWERVYSIYCTRSGRPKRKIIRTFPLTGLLKCPSCGKSMVPWHVRQTRKDGTVRTNFFYQCSEFNAGRPCKANLLNADNVEHLVFERLKNLLGNPEAIQQIAASATVKLDKTRTPLILKLREIENELTRLEDRQKQAFHAFETGRLTHDQFLITLNDLNVEGRTLQLEKDAMERELSTRSIQAYPLDKVEEALLQLRKMLDSQSGERTKQLLRLLIEKITVPPDRNLQGLTIIGGPALLNTKLSSRRI